MTYRDDGKPLREEIVDYHEQIDDATAELSKLKHVGEQLLAVERGKWDGKWWWIESATFSLTDLKVVEPTADRIVKLIRKMGVKPGHKFVLQKRIIQGDDCVQLYSRRIYQTRNTNWQLQTPRQPVLTLRPAITAKTKYPPHLQYVSKMAARCYGIGGDEISHLFEDEDDLCAFISCLATRDRKELVELYKTIVRKKHNQWFINWGREYEGDELDWANEFEWFLGVLDRLREGGLLSSTRGIAKKTVLRYWDDYLCGAPHTVGPT